MGALGIFSVSLFACCLCPLVISFEALETEAFAVQEVRGLCVDFQLAEAEEFVLRIGNEDKGGEFDGFTVVARRIGILGREFGSYKAKGAAEFDALSVGPVSQEPGSVRTNDGGDGFSVKDFDFGGLTQGDGEVFGINFGISGRFRLGSGRLLFAQAFWGRVFGEEELAEAVEFALSLIETSFESAEMFGYGRTPVVGRQKSFLEFGFEMVEMMAEPLAAVSGVN